MNISRAAYEFGRWRLGAAVALLLAVVAVYANAFRAPFVFDDVAAVVAAARLAGDARPGVIPAARDPGETLSGRPVLAATFALNYALHGERVWGYRAFNVLTHACAGLLLFGIARRATPRPGLALALAGIWVLHPLQTEAVTYVVQRAESLMGLFYLLTGYAFVRGVALDGAGQVWRRRAWFAVSVAACALGMATKEVMVSAPLMVLLYDRTFVAGGFRAAWSRRRLYYLTLGATWLLLAALVAGTGGRGGTAGFDTPVGAGEYLFTQFYAVVRYLRLAVWPQGLVFDYGTDLVRDPAAIVGSGLLLALLGGLTVWATRHRPAAGFLGCFFFATLAPSSSFVPVASQTMAEHRMYLALIAPVALALGVLSRAAGRAAAPVWLAAACAGAGLTYARNHTYRTELRLWADTAANWPGNARAHLNLGQAELKQGRVEPAMAQFEAALRLHPDSADAHYDLGLCLARLGRTADAIVHYERALAARPDYAEAHNNLGNALLALDRPADARQHYERALQLRADFTAAHANLSDALLRLGEPAEALRHAEAALRLDPDFAAARLNAGNACAELHRFAEARAHYEAALRLQPDDPDAHNNLANVLLETDRPEEAVRHYQRALQLRPDMTRARRNLAFLLLHLGRAADALPELEALSRLTPADPEVLRALAEARAGVRR